MKPGYVPRAGGAEDHKGSALSLHSQSIKVKAEPEHRFGNLAIIFPKTQETGYPRDRIEKIQKIEKCTIQVNQTRVMGMKKMGNGVEGVREEREEEWR